MGRLAGLHTSDNGVVRIQNRRTTKQECSQTVESNRSSQNNFSLLKTGTKVTFKNKMFKMHVDTTT